MEVDYFLLQGDVLGTIEPWYAAKLFPTRRIPHYFSFLKKSLHFINEHTLFYHHYIKNALRQKPVQNGHEKPPKNGVFRGRISLRHKQLFLKDAKYGKN